MLIDPFSTSSVAPGFVVPIPTLLPDTEMGELLTVEFPVKTGTVPEVPLPVIVCATPVVQSIRLTPTPATVLHIAIDFLLLKPLTVFR
ncbi:hypothetical protein [Paracidobacterium acidisoli]|uniref:Uncharacterized protein n=1 Tax=Paracidobacterium acidisoli TaxID=2303751 RepID=A0A372IJH0_9BACT|nr:hypothetical protein [Paracidobacterium acidisoli]MBT9332957.1 hypothetical protein [Paracidobacterium acidisoli]